jgi:hypothetical protein
MFIMTLVVCHMMAGCVTFTDTVDPGYPTRAACTHRAMDVFKSYSQMLIARGLPVRADMMKVAIMCEKKGAA